MIAWWWLLIAWVSPQWRVPVQGLGHEDSPQ